MLLLDNLSEVYVTRMKLSPRVLRARIEDLDRAGRLTRAKVRGKDQGLA